MKARATLEAREDVTDRNFETRRQMTARVSHAPSGSLCNRHFSPRVSCQPDP